MDKFSATNQNRPCLPSESVSKIRVVCPPEMQSIADEFFDMAQPIKNDNFLSMDDQDEIQIAQPNRTKCKLLLRYDFATI